MRMSRNKMGMSLLFAGLLLLAACNEEVVPEQGITDADLLAAIAALLAQQTDLPSGLAVVVNAGRVTISGSLECADCAGWETPGTAGTVQQSVGAVVRAVPGVVDVRFAFATTP